MTNNDILKKLRVALQLRDDQIVEILELVDFRVSKGEIGNFFRTEDHPKYVECKDQILRNFLNGLVIYLRGTKENPKNPKEVLAGISASKIALTDTQKVDGKPKATSNTKNASTAKPAFKSKKNVAPKKTMPSTKKDVLGNVKFNNGKPKKKNDQ
ncbi:DUF1456 family protein [Paenimyroides aestuarii]|uniref:DUF1456 family protein n=1 Tax=Paenimyroides aestuarii TaxID=2968490 RepID=A0ABY5NRF4_9FLAO|nr:DUF1456 family protein [Paenimyroides aestuarii]UUV21064.1 DUF1456 family protein [Paenimyroides aestuarii]